VSNNAFSHDGDETATLARLHTRLRRRADESGLLDVAYRTIDTPVGVLLLAATDSGLVRVAYDVQDHTRVLDALARSVSPRILRAPARLDTAARQIDDYFSKRRKQFELLLDLRLPIVIGCHRVVRSDGSTGQYAGGEQAKSALLRLEAG
jgi:methylated-DNA-[protein]-cysteine S-methyltransferase